MDLNNRKMKNHPPFPVVLYTTYLQLAEYIFTQRQLQNI